VTGVKLTPAQETGLLAIATGKLLYGGKVSNQTAAAAERREPLVYWKVAETLERLELVELYAGRTWARLTTAGMALAEQLSGATRP
jgi:hypothetical protein